MAANISADEETIDLGPVHPGEMLAEEFMRPLGLTAYGLAVKLHIPRARLERLIRGRNAVTPDTALRLSKAFRTTPEFWMNLQARYDLASPNIREAAGLGDIEPIAMAEVA